MVALLVLSIPVVFGIRAGRHAERIDRQELAYNLERLHRDFAGDGQIYIAHEDRYVSTRDVRIHGELAALGSIRDQRTLASLYYYGYGVPTDYVASVYWSERAARQGDTDAMVTTGYLYWQYLGDSIVGRYWLEQARSLGNPCGDKFINYLEKQD